VRNINRIKSIHSWIKEDSIEVLIGFTYLASYVAIISAFLLKVKIVITERTDPGNASKLMRLIKRILYRRADGGIFQTDYVRGFFKGIIKNTIVIPNMIDSDNLPSALNYKERDNRIVSVGRLDSLKNYEFLIDAIYNIQDQLIDYTVDIYGDGELFDDLQEQINRLGLNSLVFLRGRTKDVCNKIRDAKLFVFSSLVEGFPNVLLEASAMGLPIVVLDSPSYAQRDLLRDDRYSVIVTNNDPKAFAQAILTVLNNPCDDNLIAERCTYIREKYNSANIGKQWLQFIDNVYKNK